MIAHPPADWRVPWRTIIVATVERSGSKFLCDLMTQTARLGKPEEYFSPYVLRRWFAGRGAHAADSCRLVLEAGTTSNEVASCKLFPFHFQLLQGEIKLTEWFGAPRWVWLRRQDLLGQAISLSIALQAHRWHHDDPQESTPVYKPGDIDRTLNRLSKHIAMWETYFARTGISPLEIWYEDVSADPKAAVETIGAFADVDVTDTTVTAGLRVKKQRSELNREWRRRFLADRGTIDQLTVPPTAAPRHHARVKQELRQPSRWRWIPWGRRANQGRK